MNLNKSKWIVISKPLNGFLSALISSSFPHPHHSLLFLSSSILIWLMSTSEPLPEVQTSEWRHQVVPTVVRPNVRRPVAPLPVNAPTSPFSSSPFILPPPSSMIPDPHIYAQASTVAPVIASISVPSIDTLTGTYAGLNLYLCFILILCLYAVNMCVVHWVDNRELFLNVLS